MPLALFQEEKLWNYFPFWSKWYAVVDYGLKGWEEKDKTFVILFLE